MKKLYAGLVTASVVLSLAAPAQAEKLGCGYEYLTPFSAYGDDGLYGLAPSGSFEDGATDWTLSGGAAVAAPGSGLRAESALFSLSLPPGSSATSPPICVKAGSPWARMFAYTSTLDPKVKRGLRVTLIYTDNVTGRKVTRPVARLHQEAFWAPTRRLALGGPLSVKPGNTGRKSVRYEFTPLHGTAWSIDDLFIDPKRR